ncbi:hypothetical protein TPMD03_28 [Thiohalocapsa phage LS06-2018-MD03]|nr:hypothetical protein TPMD03_28 [Thiohalocapsa phage LS06-2018-MD03]
MPTWRDRLKVRLRYSGFDSHRHPSCIMFWFNM